MDRQELPEEIGKAAKKGDFDRVKAWLAGGSASDPRSINGGDGTGWTLLHWTMIGDQTPGHLEFARYLLSRGAQVDAKTYQGSTPLHFACEIVTGETAAALVSLLIAAGAAVNMVNSAYLGATPLFCIDELSESTIDVVTTLLRAGASLDSSNRSFEEHLNSINGVDPYGENARHVRAVRTLVSSVRAAGSWKAHCRLAHKQVLRLRSLVARGRVKLPRTRHPRGRDARQKRALAFVVRQGDNGIVWNILSFWRATA